MKKLGLTQEAVAERLGMAQSTLSLKLNNER
nr:helix-turn-helix transcriptional regulator [Ruminococcus sp.]